MLERIKRVAYAFRSAISKLSSPQRWFIEMFGGRESKAGAQVSETTAIQVTAVFACIRLLGQVLASLPLHTYRRTANGKEKAQDLPLYFTLHTLWNAECTSYTGRLIMMVNLLLTGNAYAEIVRNKAGDVIELWPIPSDRVMPRRNQKAHEVFYEVYTMDGQTRFLYREQMLHIQCCLLYTSAMIYGLDRDNKRIWTGRGYETVKDDWNDEKIWRAAWSDKKIWGMVNPSLGHTAVSYTHLDVYKRQVQIRLLSRSRP